MLELAKSYNASVKEEKDVPPEKLAVMNVGKIDAKRRLGAEMTNVMSSNITQVRCRRTVRKCRDQLGCLLTTCL